MNWTKLSIQRIFPVVVFLRLQSLNCYMGATCSNRREEVLKEVEAFYIESLLSCLSMTLCFTFTEIKSDLRFKGTLIDDLICSLVLQPSITT